MALFSGFRWMRPTRCVDAIARQKESGVEGSRLSTRIQYRRFEIQWKLSSEWAQTHDGGWHEFGTTEQGYKRAGKALGEDDIVAQWLDGELWCSISAKVILLGKITLKIF